MVVPKLWLSDPRGRPRDESEPVGSDLRDGLGILAFEAAAAMARLVSLHRSLSEGELLKLRAETMRSPGVSYLISADQPLLLRLACAEYVADLDRAADTVARLGSKCSEPGALTRGFARVYDDFKSGSADTDGLGLKLTSKAAAEKRVKRMEREILATAKLCEEMEVLAELEATERRWWGRYSGPIPSQKPSAGSESLTVELRAQRQKVRRLKEESLWSQSFEKAVRLMGQAALAVFARICAVFGPFVPGLPPVVVLAPTRIGFIPAQLRFHLHRRSPEKYSSGPLERPVAKNVSASYSCPIFQRSKEAELKPEKVLKASSNTVGGSGLALRYANIVVLAEKRLRMRSDTGEEAAAAAAAATAKEEWAAREELYRMLPAALKTAVKAKLMDCYRDRGPADRGLAEGWKEASRRILGWLGPVAHDTVRWDAERNMDRRHRFDVRPRALLLQTLHFADREKTEAAIAEVLAGLSCVSWYEEPRQVSSRF